MDARELIAELYKVETEWRGPADTFNRRIEIAQRYLREAYAKGRRESIELSDEFGYTRNVNKFVKQVISVSKEKP